MQQEEFDFARERDGGQLYLAGSLAEAWSDVLAPWFRKVAPTAWRRARAVGVLVPHRSHAHWLKARLLDQEISYLGVRFLTPAGLRESIAVASGHRVRARADLRLLLAATARKYLSGEDSPERRAAKAVARTPAHLLQTLERLAAAGWDLRALENPVLREIASDFENALRSEGWQLEAEIDRALVLSGPPDEPLFSDLLVAGFDGAHWGQWFLLQAAVARAEDPVVALTAPHSEAFALDELWVGSWEQKFGEAVPCQHEDRAAAEAAPQKLFLVSLDATEQARAVARLTLDFLAQAGADRIGILLPRGGSLARLVGEELARAEIPHNDTFGFSRPGEFEKTDWEYWLRFQQAPRLLSLLDLLRVLPPASPLFAEVDFHRAEKALRNAYAQLLVDDLALLQAFCARSGRPGQAEVARLLSQLGVLPLRAKWPEFLQVTTKALETLAWTERAGLVAQQGSEVGSLLEEELPRTLFLRWLNESCATATATRQPQGDQPYARVHLMSFAQAEGQSFSHLIIGGLNEGEWPPPDAGDFSGEAQIEAYNESIARLNRKAARSGRQGIGHTSIKEGHALYLGPVQTRALEMRRFESLLETGAGSIAFLTSLANEAEPERLRNPSEAFTRLFFVEHDLPLTATVLKELREKTRAWLGLDEAPKPELKSPAQQTRRAYDARRDRALAAGPFDFTLRQPAADPPFFSVSEFERVLATPGLAWMSRFLGVEASEDLGGAWAASTGQWVHHWLRSIAPAQGTFARIPAADEIDRKICEAAEEKRRELVALCQSIGVTLPDWWLSGWHNARALARHLGARLASASGWDWLAAEWKIEQAIALRDELVLRVRGRIDLVLSPKALPESSLSSEPLWIIDFKTGNRNSLAVSKPDPAKVKATLRKRLLEGDALQLALYALAAEAAGARQVSFSLVSPMVRPVEPQLEIAQFEDQREVFEELARMQANGQFGMLGTLRGPFRFHPPYPIATLPIDQYILDQKWDRTHPALAREEEERW